MTDSEFVPGEEAETDAEKAFRSFGEFVAGGVWKATREGNDIAIRYTWLANKRFLKLSASENETGSPMMVVGIDPDTSKATIWGFSDRGFVKSILTLEKEGSWVVDSAASDADRMRFKTTRVGPDEYHLEVFELGEDGSEQSLGPAWPWKRDKSQ